MTETALWVVLDVGCLECGDPSGVLGVFEDKDRAQEVCYRHLAQYRKEGGETERSFNVYRVPGLNQELEGVG